MSLAASAVTAIAAAIRDVADSLGTAGLITIAALGGLAALYIIRERHIKSYREGI